MTTVLGASASLVIRVGALMVVALGILLLISAAAMAQDAVAVTPTGPAPVDDSWAASIALIRDSLIATILAVIAGVISWASAHAPAWLRAIIDKLTTSEAIEWDDHVRIALTNAFDIAAAKVGVTPENLESLEQKADFMGWAVGALRKYNKEIVSFADKDQNGIVDLVEIELAKRGANPKLFQVEPEPFPLDMPPQAPQAAMGFVGGSQSRRVQRVPAATPEAALASKFSARGKKGAVN